MADLSYLGAEVAAWKAAGVYQPLRPMGSAQGPVVELEGREVIQLASNNYLGLANHPRLKEAAQQALEAYGVGTGSVRTIAGAMELHEQLEQELAAFKKTEASLVFPSGFMTNLAILSSLLTDQDTVISDALNHASIIDGIRLTKAKRAIYRHVDLADLESHLQAAASSRLRLVVTDGVFSMDGNIAPLPAIVELCERYDALLMVDDAHASGVLGAQGRGTIDHFGLHGRVAIQVGTLSKAIGVLGGYVACDQVLREYLIQRARPLLFTTSLPPAVVAACRAAFALLQEEGEERLQRLWTNTERLRKGLREHGFTVGPTATPITPVMLGEEGLAVRFADRLLAEGVFASAIVYPTVPKGKARLRTIMTSEHSSAMIDTCLAAFARVAQQLGAH